MGAGLLPSLVAGGEGKPKVGLGTLSRSLGRDGRAEGSRKPTGSFLKPVLQPEQAGAFFHTLLAHWAQHPETRSHARPDNERVAIWKVLRTVPGTDPGVNPCRARPSLFLP